MRLTGLASGLDMDQIIKDSMKPYRIKIDTEQQKKEIIEIKQKLYREVVNDSREFYNKYFDITSKDSLLLSSNFKSIKFTSSDESVVTVNGGVEAKGETYKITGTTGTATKAVVTTNIEAGKIIKINGKDFTLKGTNQREIAINLNNDLSSEGLTISVRYSDLAGDTTSGNKSGLIFESKTLGSNSTFTVDSAVVTPGNDAEIIFTDSKNGVYKYTGNSNTVTLDGVTFKFNGKIPQEGVVVNGKVDVTETKDKLVNFINDYNKLMEKFNTMTMEKRDGSYMPLSADQKKEMSENEIKLWNEKVQKGQLSRDSDINRISNNMKQAMSSLVTGVDLNLEKIGIIPIADYAGVKKGSFTIDEDKLTKALEEKSEEVMKLFIQVEPTDPNMASDKKYISTGMMQRIKKILYEETVTVASSIIKKAGIEGSITSFNNQLTSSIEKYEIKMKSMEKDFSRREQLLYTKYSRLEVAMNNYNSQQSYLTQQLGM